MTSAELRDRVEKLLAEVLEGEAETLAVDVRHDECRVLTPSEHVHEVLAGLKDAGFDALVFVTAVDRLDHLTLVYRLADMSDASQLFVEADVDRDAPEVPTATDLWPAADWHEREARDLFGVVFTGHPNLKPLILPEGWVGHPLLKDYQDASMERRPNYS